VTRARGTVVARRQRDPLPAKAAAFNTMEMLRDPSHVRAMPMDELRAPPARCRPCGRHWFTNYRLEGEFARPARALVSETPKTYPNCVGCSKPRRSDALRRRGAPRCGRFAIGYPVAILVSRKL
jgi:hypothetical protein